jgi:hypothetical protein
LKLKSAVPIAAIKAAFSELGLTATPSTAATTGIATTNKIQFNVATLNKILMQVEQGDFILFASLFDTFFVRDGAAPSDAAVLSFFKSFTDDAAVADEALVVLGRVLADTFGATDEITRRDFIKGLLDTPVVSESHSLGFARPVDDAYSVSEQVSLGPNKVPFDTVGSVDEINTIGFGKVPSDGVNFSDSTTDVIAFGFDINLPKMPGPYFAEDYVEVGYTDQEGFAFARDLPSMGPGKVLDDGFSVSETFTRQSNYLREFTDVVYFTDDVDGNASILDDQEMQFFKFTTDIPGVSDLFERTVAYSRAFSETPSASESINVLTSKFIYDIPVASETIAKSYSRLSADSALLGDAAIVAQGKVLLNLAAITDTGSLLSQGFTSDPTYFAEDFVGSSTTF